MAKRKVALIGDESDDLRWKRIIRHTDAEVFGFFDEYRFLSNFFPAVVFYEGDYYPSVENAYQAAKFLESERGAFFSCSAGTAKRLGKEELNRKYTDAVWKEKKRPIMKELTLSKYNLNLELLLLLMKTEGRKLVEANWWEDTFWGVYVPPVGEPYGENNLGEVLMEAREELFYR